MGHERLARLTQEGLVLPMCEIDYFLYIKNSKSNYYSVLMIVICMMIALHLLITQIFLMINKVATRISDSQKYKVCQDLVTKHRKPSPAEHSERNAIFFSATVHCIIQSYIIVL